MSARVLGIVVGVLLTGVPRVGAELIHWTCSGGVVTTGPSGGLWPKVLVSASMRTDGSMGSITPNRRVEFADVLGVGSGSAEVAAFPMRAHTGASVITEGPFHKEFHTFGLGFTITDSASGDSGTFTFLGSLEGNVAPVPRPSTLGMAFSGPLDQALRLGDHLYQITALPPRIQYFATQEGYGPSTNMNVSVQVSEAPEPSTLVLGALGLSALGLRGWRRRNAARAQPA